MSKQIEALEISPVEARLIRLAEVGSSRLYQKSLDALSGVLGKNPSLEDMLALATAGAEQEEDIKFVNLVLTAFNESTKGKEEINTEKKFELFVDDNFHFMDEDERYKSGSFDTYEEAVVAAKAIVDSFLENHYEPGMTAESLYKGYSMYGEDPFIVGDLGKEQRDAVLSRAEAIKNEMESRLAAHGDNFEELNKPMDFPANDLFFSASDYARVRCDELCKHEDFIAKVLRYFVWPLRRARQAIQFGTSMKA